MDVFLQFSSPAMHLNRKDVKVTNKKPASKRERRLVALHIRNM